MAAAELRGSSAGTGRRTHASRRVAAALGATVVLVVAIAVVIGTHGGRAGSAPGGGPSGPFVPPVRQEGGVDVVPLTLLDGRRLQLRYPPALGIAQLGLTLVTEMTWPVGATPSQCCTARVSASRATIGGAYGTERPLATFPGAHGQVSLLSATGRRLPPGFTGPQNLVFQFSGWLVEVDTSPTAADGVPPPMTGEDLRLWAADLRASGAPGGYLILDPRPPLALAAHGLISSRSAIFGLGRPNEPQGNTLDIEDGYCGQPTSDTSTRTRFQTDDGLAGVAWCDPGSGLHVSAIGSQQFVGLVASGLTITVP